MGSGEKRQAESRLSHAAEYPVRTHVAEEEIIMRGTTILMLCAAAAMLFSCGNLVGGGDDFPNSKIAGVIVNTNMTSAARTMVRLVPEGHNSFVDQPPAASNIDTTDTAGR